MEDMRHAVDLPQDAVDTITYSQMLLQRFDKDITRFRDNSLTYDGISQTDDRRFLGDILDLLYIQFACALSDQLDFLSVLDVFDDVIQ